jgi:asparagine synthase (glutamine-hydrolysing)
MANFVVVVDGDDRRRQAFLTAAEREVAFVEGLAHGRLEHGDFGAVWACSSTAPRSQFRDANSIAMLFGDAIEDDGTRADASRVSELWLRSGRTSPVWDGYFAGFAYGRSVGLTVGGDILGLFPLYWYEWSSGVMVASSPDLFRHHPCFTTTISAEGLAGILLTNGLLNGQSILEDVRRVAAGSLLRWCPGRAVRLEPQYSIPGTERLPGRTPKQLHELVEGTLEDVIRRHAPAGKPTSLLLSGGLDSRTVAGYLKRLQLETAPLCMGLTTDLEFIAANRVARALGWRLDRPSPDPDAGVHAELAERTAKWEHLAAGFGGMDFWAAGVEAGRMGERFWSGLLMDDLIGGNAMAFAFDRRQRRWSVDQFVQRLTGWGVPMERLSQLLRPVGGRDLVGDVQSSLRNVFTQGTDAAWQRSFRGKLSTRTRFHLGAGFWRLCFGGWPIAPMIDRRLLELTIDLPPHLVMARKLERSLLARRFPPLARIPLDSNSWRFEPIRRGLVGSVIRLLPGRRLIHRWQGRGPEFRRYHRLYDINDRYWRAIRSRAEPHRSNLRAWMDDRLVAELLPPPHDKTQLSDVFGAGSVRRALLGLMLWTGVNSEPRGAIDADCVLAAHGA